MNVGELCTRVVVIGHEDESILTGARRMRDHHVGTLVIVEDTRAGRRPVGIVTDRDLLIALAEGGVAADERSVAEVMARQLVTAHESEPVHRALDRMRERGVRRLPVVDDEGILIGILAYDDLVEWVAEQLTSLGTLVENEQRRERGIRA